MKLRRKIRLLIVSALTLILVTGCTKKTQTSAPEQVAVKNNYYANKINVNAKAALAIDRSTGQILYGKNINQPLPIASMTKLITVYLTLAAIKEGRLAWTDKVEPTKAIVKVANNPDFSNVSLKAGHSYTIRQLYQATLIESANGAAMCLGQKIAGSQEKFVNLMRQKLQTWQINDAQVYTSCGLPNKDVAQAAYPNANPHAENKLSAKDMAIVCQKLLQDFPEALKTTKITRLNFVDGAKKTPMTNFNLMLPHLSQYDPNLPIDGLKTGTTAAAGACFAGTLNYRGGRLITIIVGAPHQNINDPARFLETKKLLNYLLTNYQPVTIKPDQVVKREKLTIASAQDDTTKVGLGHKTVVWDPLDGKQLKMTLAQKKLRAPLTKGQVVGQYTFKSGVTNLVSLSQPAGLGAQAQTLAPVKKRGFLSNLFGY